MTMFRGQTMDMVAARLVDAGWPLAAARMMAAYMTNRDMPPPPWSTLVAAAPHDDAGRMAATGSATRRGRRTAADRLHPCPLRCFAARQGSVCGPVRDARDGSGIARGW